MSELTSDWRYILGRIEEVEDTHKDLTRKEIAQRSGLDQATLSRYLNGARSIPPKHQTMIWQAMGAAKEARKQKAPRLQPRG